MARKRLYPRQEAYTELGIGPSTGDGLCRGGLLDARRIGRKILITGESLDRYIASLPKWHAKTDSRQLELEWTDASEEAA